MPKLSWLQPAALLVAVVPVCDPRFQRWLLRVLSAAATAAVAAATVEYWQTCRVTPSACLR